jgi:hypothetical protein
MSYINPSYLKGANPFAETGLTFGLILEEFVFRCLSLFFVFFIFFYFGFVCFVFCFCLFVCFVFVCLFVLFLFVCLFCLYDCRLLLCIWVFFALRQFW